MFKMYGIISSISKRLDRSKRLKAMNIIKDNRIIEKYKFNEKKKFHRTASDIYEIVIHGTGSPKKQTSKGLLSWTLNPGKEKEIRYYKGIGLYPYLVDLDGSIIQFYDPSKYWTHHSTCGIHDKKTIGIELMNNSPYNKNEYTNEQYKSLLDLIDHLCYDYQHIDSIAGHKTNIKKYSPDTYAKNCPGNFRWDILSDELISRNWQHHYKNEFIWGLKNE